MKKLIFFAVFLMFTGVNSAVVYFADRDDNNIEMPIGDGEEESRTISLEDDDEVILNHRWLSKEKSSDSDLHFVYHDILFHNLELEVLAPPPKALS